MNRYVRNEFIKSKYCSFVKVNVGGRIFKLEWQSIRRYHNSRLDKICKARNKEEISSLCDEYNLNTNEYFFDRHPKYFEMIWNIVNSGYFYFTTEYCSSTMLDELRYWGYSSDNCMIPCCKYDFFKERENVEEEIHKDRAIMKQLDIADAYERENKLGKFKKTLWNIMEQPDTSLLARIVSILSIFFILLSTFCLIISTLSIFHNISNTTNIFLQTNYTVNKATIAEDVFENIEYACIIWFSLEYILRFMSASNQLKFMIQFLNVVDLISIVPFYLTLIINLIFQNQNYASLESLSRVVQVFRILRILRVFKLARHSVGLQSLGYTLQKSNKELGLLISFIIIGVFLFSSMVYFAERDDNKKMFPSIPGSFWWAIISMTTVGYGDCFPITAFGQIIASVCCVTGVLVVALPIPIIVSNFSEFYKDKMRIEKTKSRREELNKNNCQQVTSVLVNSIAQHTLSFFHGFGRANSINNISVHTNSHHDNSFSKRKQKSNCTISHLSNRTDDYDDYDGIYQWCDGGANNTMSILLNTEHWRYIDSSTSSSSCCDTDIEEI